MPIDNRPPTPHPATDTVLVGKKIVKTKSTQSECVHFTPVIEESSQKISH
jgi:hypothetical protein